MTIAIAYNLMGNGWAECFVEIDDREQSVRYDFPLELQAKLKASLDRTRNQH